MKSWTVSSLLETATQFLREKLYDYPRLDAELLLAETLKLRRIDLYLQHDRSIKEEEVAQFRELIKKRSEGCPTAYLLGRKEFFSIMFEVNNNVMIPRPETEHLVIEVLYTCEKEKIEAPLIADIGTGSGNIAVSIAKNLPSAVIWAIDTSGEALKCAEKNIANHELQERIELLESDYMEALSGKGLEERLDFVVSNPPYIANKEFETLPVGIKNYEPELAFLAGEDGLNSYKTIIPESVDFLMSGGHLILEIGAGSSDKIKMIVEENGFYCNTVIKKDFSSIERVLHTQKK
ncbi:MAG: peptide chain release factor N(5)-glutamine methyltransferase [Planctomycetota bacterium]